jgi:hypothetical protein
MSVDVKMETSCNLNISVDAPKIGGGSQYIAHAVDTTAHSDFVQFLHDMSKGTLHTEKFQFTHELMTLLGVPQGVDEYSRHYLLKLPHMMPPNKRDHKVCVLLRRQSMLSTTCAMRALMLLFRDRQGVDKMQVILLPDSTCTLVDSTRLGKNALKTDPWRRVLNRLQIAPAEIVHDVHAILQAKQETILLSAGYSLRLEQPEQLKQRLSHMTITLLHNTLSDTNLEICKSHLREKLDSLLKQYVVSCKEMGATAVPGITETIAVSEHHCINIEMVHMARLCCSLKSVQDGSVISSTTVNFAKNMVFATVLAPMYRNVIGLQKIALLAAAKLQTALTPEFLAHYVIPMDASSKQLMQLMLSKDLHDEIRNANPYVTQLVTDFMLTDRVSFEEKTRLQQHVFQNSTLLSEKRLRSSAATPTTHKADRCAGGGLYDKFNTHNMIAARGVATAQLFCIRAQLPSSENCYAQFSNVSTMRVVKQSTATENVLAENMGKRTYLTWHTPSDSGVPQTLADVKDASVQQFFFTQSQRPAVRELRVYRQQDEVHTPIAVFKDNFELEKLNTSGCRERHAPLICALLKSYVGDNKTSLYRKALINLIFRTLLRQRSQQDTNGHWLEHFRCEWLQKHYQEEPVSEKEANKLYLEYSLFSECLKRNVQGLQIPANVFSVVVQEVLPFPSV